MARPKSDGLLYFPFDTDFFYSDKKIKALRARYGCDGLVIYIYLLTEIYRNGYFIWWDEESEENMMADLNLSEGLIKQVIAFLISRSLLQSILVNSDTAFTSPGIQKRYQEVVKSLKRDIFVQKELWLLEEAKTATCIKFTKKYDKSEKNESKSEKNESKSEKNATKEMKRNETKLEDISPVTRFDDFVAAYPKTIRNRIVAEQAYCKILIDDSHMEESELIIAAENYADAVCILGTEERYIKNAENFLKDNFFAAYLDGNYEKPKPEKKGRQNKFTAFEQRNMSKQELDDLEKELLSY